LDDRQDGVFAEAGVRFSQAAHDKKAALGAFDDFDMLAGGAEADPWGNLHGASLAQSWCSAKDNCKIVCVPSKCDYHSCDKNFVRRQMMPTEDFDPQSFNSITKIHD
jgi:hypothetical protein